MDPEQLAEPLGEPQPRPESKTEACTGLHRSFAHTVRRFVSAVRQMLGADLQYVAL